MTDAVPSISRTDMRTVANIWHAMEKFGSNRLDLALRRLNTAMTRDDLSDAILDATIALEVLLGDGDGQAKVNDALLNLGVPHW